MRKTLTENKSGVQKPGGDQPYSRDAKSALATELRRVFCEADLPFMADRIIAGSGDTAAIDEDNLDRRATASEFGAWAEAPDPAPYFDFLKKQIEPVYSREQIVTRVQQLGAEISRHYAGRHRPLVVLGVLNGCSPFLTDLLRAISDTLPIEVDFVRVSFYGNETVPGSLASVSENCYLPIEGRDVLVVDDIQDSGKTMNSVIGRLYELHPNSVRGCVCVVKKREPAAHVPELNYRGFEINTGWVVGYGMDYQQYFRNLPYIGVINKDVDREAQ